MHAFFEVIRPRSKQFTNNFQILVIFLKFIMLLSNSHTPGPGSYNTDITCRRSYSIQSYTCPVVLCFFKGAEPCSSCEKLLYGDYYKSSSGKVNYCLGCYRKIFDPVRRKPSNFHKVRHCISYHKHIDVENIIYHKTTSKQIRRLGLMEKCMWSRFGISVDHKGKPI